MGLSFLMAEDYLSSSSSTEYHVKEERNQRQ